MILVEKEHNIIIFKDDDFTIDVNLDIDKKTVWLSQDQMVKLFATDKSRISRHIRNILLEEELDEKTTVAESATVQFEGLRSVKRTLKVYNLDMIISVGFRIKSKRGMIFRRWANEIIQDYMLKGYTLNQEKLLESKEYYNDFTKSVKFISELYKRKNLDKIESNSLL